MPTVKTGQHYCNDRCTVDNQPVNCYNYNRNRNYGFWTEEESDSYSRLYIPSASSPSYTYSGQTRGACISHLKTPFVAFSPDNIVAVTWKGDDSKSGTGTCYVYKQVGESCTTPVENINISVKPKDRDEMAPGVTNFVQHALKNWFR